MRKSDSNQHSVACSNSRLLCLLVKYCARKRELRHSAKMRWTRDKVDDRVAAMPKIERFSDCAECYCILVLGQRQNHTQSLNGRQCACVGMPSGYTMQCTVQFHLGFIRWRANCWGWRFRFSCSTDGKPSDCVLHCHRRIEFRAIPANASLKAKVKKPNQNLLSCSCQWFSATSELIGGWIFFLLMHNFW